jgi:hypothetical protein
MSYTTVRKEIIVPAGDHNLFITVEVGGRQFHNDTLSLKGNPLARDPIINKDLGKLSNQDGFTYKLRSEVSHINPEERKCEVNVILKVNNNAADNVFSEPSNPGDIVEFIIFIKIVKQP